MRGWMLAAVGATLLAGAARAQSFGADGGPVQQTQGTAPPVQPPPFPGPGVTPFPGALPGGMDRPQLPATLADARPPSASALRLNPQMIGDFRPRAFLIRTLPPATRNARPRTTRIPIFSGGAFKIADNESPRPVDRLFATYNYYNNVNTFGGRDFDVHREVFGFEKTFLDGNASFGM